MHDIVLVERAGSQLLSWVKRGAERIGGGKRASVESCISLTTLNVLTFLLQVEMGSIYCTVSFPLYRLSLIGFLYSNIENMSDIITYWLTL